MGAAHMLPRDLWKLTCAYAGLEWSHALELTAYCCSGRVEDARALRRCHKLSADDLRRVGAFAAVCRSGNLRAVQWLCLHWKWTKDQDLGPKLCVYHQIGKLRHWKLAAFIRKHFKLTSAEQKAPPPAAESTYADYSLLSGDFSGFVVRPKAHSSRSNRNRMRKAEEQSPALLLRESISRHQRRRARTPIS